ncbi:dynamin family protein, partial [Burkholderia multivorans]|uniref:dynamin family protein n=1 Tax=Burkholderia multivorans TaxID=87883 RepID=UPI001C65F985
MTPPVGGALSDIAKKISETRFTLQTDDAADGRRLLGSLSSEMGDFILPRINRAPAPFLIAVGGSTGAGKSTLVNSLIGRTVSPAGVRRPTTANPIVIHNPADAKHFETATFLADLPRSSDPETTSPALVLIPDAD